MFYWPIIDKIAEWVKSQGGWPYWIFVLITGAAGAFLIKMWSDYGLVQSVKIYLGAFIIWWIGGGLLVSYFEGKRKTEG